MLGTVLPPFRGVIFDLDGLVLDTEPTFQLAWQQAADALGYRFTKAMCRSFSGRHYADIEQAIVQRCGAAFPTERFRQLSAQFWRRHVDASGIEVMPGVEPLLQALLRRGIPFCLATNSERAVALECLRLAGLNGCFTKIIAHDQVRRGKPAPDIIVVAAHRLDRPVCACLVLEDSMIGIRAAQRAGAIPVQITARRKLIDAAGSEPYLVLNSLLDVAARLE